MPLNQQILLDNRPSGEAVASNFKLVSSDTPALTDGQVLVRHHFMSLDPYMRGRMNDAKSYAQPQALGQVMGGGTAGEVVESKNPKFAVGDKVVGMGGWQEYSVVDANQPGALRKVDTTHVPLSHYLGAVGMPGVTAWYGLVKIIEPKAGQTVVISAATGAVGSAFGALAKARGCRAVGIAGGPDKCKYAVEELGFDACIDYKQHKDAASLSKALKEAEALLEKVGLSGRAGHKPGELSGGEKQRVAMARALANEPKFLLADEPTGNLDSKSGEEVMELIRQLWKNGATIVMVTHEPVVAGYSQRIIRIRDGKVESEESPAGLLKSGLKVK